MPAPSTCICTLQVKNFLAASFTSCELVAEPRKSFIYGSEHLILSRPVRASASAGGVCTLTLVQTDTPNAKIQFRLEFNDGNSFGSVIFDPIEIPAQTSVDLATILSVSRG